MKSLFFAKKQNPQKSGFFYYVDYWKICVLLIRAKSANSRPLRDSPNQSCCKKTKVFLHRFLGNLQNWKMAEIRQKFFSFLWKNVLQKNLGFLATGKIRLQCSVCAPLQFSHESIFAVLILPTTPWSPPPIITHKTHPRFAGPDGGELFRSYSAPLGRGIRRVFRPFGEGDQRSWWRGLYHPGTP